MINVCSYEYIYTCALIKKNCDLIKKTDKIRDSTPPKLSPRLENVLSQTCPHSLSSQNTYLYERNEILEEGLFIQCKFVVLIGNMIMFYL